MPETTTVHSSFTGLVTEVLPKPQYELIDKDGFTCGWYGTAEQAAKFAKGFWPDQEQDPDRSGVGWDVQVVGCK